jgi:hypothetical protein
MTDRDRAAIHVGPLPDRLGLRRVATGHDERRDEGHGCEGLVDLDQVHVVDRKADLLKDEPG